MTACSSKSEPPRPEPAAEATESRAGHGDAGSGEGGGETGALDPPPRVDQEAPGRPPARPPTRAARPIDVVLRSSPPGATAAVDGVPIGPTPTYWAGEANGREHEFTFVLPGYAFARYRFVPITSGVVHARLEVLTEDSDAGVPPEIIRGFPDAPVPAGAPRPRLHAPAPDAGPPPEATAAPSDALPESSPTAPASP